MSAMHHKRAGYPFGSVVSVRRPPPFSLQHSVRVLETPKPNPNSHSSLPSFPAGVGHTSQLL